MITVAKLLISLKATWRPFEARIWAYSWNQDCKAIALATETSWLLPDKAVHTASPGCNSPSNTAVSAFSSCIEWSTSCIEWSTKLSKTCLCFKLLLQGNPSSKLNNKNAKHFGVAPPVHEESQKWGQKHILDGLAGAFWGVAKLIEKYITLHQTEMSLSIVRSPGIFFSCFSYGVQSIFWGGPFASSFSFFFTFWIHGCKAMASGQKEIWAELDPSGRHKIGWDTNHKWSHYTPVDPKQFFHIHVVLLAPDVGNFESISMGNSMNYKQHVFMYYCYLGGSMLV